LIHEYLTFKVKNGSCTQHFNYEGLIKFMSEKDPQIQTQSKDGANDIHPSARLQAFDHPAARAATSVSGGALGWSGSLLHIHVCEAASFEMEELKEATLVAGRGIVGDRYYLGNGSYSHKPDVREVTLIEQETLDALARNDPPVLQGGPIVLSPSDHRRNLTVRGVPLNHLVGRRFSIGECILRGGRLNFPCKYLEEMTGLPVFLPLYNRSGLNCGIEVGGLIRPGDAIYLLD
jgi:hypothetical protein